MFFDHVSNLHYNQIDCSRICEDFGKMTDDTDFTAIQTVNRMQNMQIMHV